MNIKKTIGAMKGKLDEVFKPQPTYMAKTINKIKEMPLKFPEKMAKIVKKR